MKRYLSIVLQAYIGGVLATALFFLITSLWEEGPLWEAILGSAIIPITFGFPYLLGGSLMIFIKEKRK